MRSAVQYICMVRYSMQYSAVQYGAVQCSAVRERVTYVPVTEKYSACEGASSINGTHPRKRPKNRKNCDESC